MVHATLAKTNVMEKLNGMNIVVQLKVQDHQNACEAISTIILHSLSFQIFQKILRPVRT